MPRTPTSSAEALAQFAQSRCETAFHQLVADHYALVHGTAMRVLNGDSHAAEDIAQEVFALLAMKAERLPVGISPGAWLYRQAYRRSLNAIRKDSRRRRRETDSRDQNVSTMKTSVNSEWSDLAPLLDRALNTLSSKDRDAVVLRHLQGYSYSEVASTLGLSPEAVRKRIERALDRLRRSLDKRGVSFHSIGPLAVLLATKPPESVPSIAVIDLVTESALGSGTTSATASSLTTFLSPVLTGLVAAPLAFLAGTSMLAPPDAPAADTVKSEGRVPANSPRVDSKSDRNRMSALVQKKIANLGPSRQLPIEMIRVGYLRTFSNYSLEPKVAEALGLDERQREEVGKIYYRSMLAFSKTWRERLMPGDTVEDGIHWAEVPPFPARAAELRREFNAALVEEIGFERARLLLAMCDQLLRQETGYYGIYRERVEIYHKDGNEHYEQIFLSPETGEVVHQNGGSSWEIGDEEIRTRGDYDSPGGMKMRASFQALGLWPVEEEDEEILP